MFICLDEIKHISAQAVCDFCKRKIAHHQKKAYLNFHMTHDLPFSSTLVVYLLPRVEQQARKLITSLKALFDSLPWWCATVVSGDSANLYTHDNHVCSAKTTSGVVLKQEVRERTQKTSPLSKNSVGTRELKGVDATKTNHFQYFLNYEVLRIR